MKLKLDGEGHAVLKDGNPVYVHEDNTEHPFDAAANVATIRARNKEAQTNRERAEAAEGKLKAFEGIEDPGAALKALGIVKNLDDKKLVDAGQVDTVKAEVNKVWEGKYGELEKRAQTLEQQLFGEIVGGAFARSKFIADKLILPPDIAQAAFGKHFKVDGGKIRAFGADGNPLFSKKNPGAEVSDFDEAIEILVETNPQRDRILKADNASGSGARNDASGNAGKKTISRDAFDRLEPAQRMEHIKKGGVVTD
jgi:hypothetical protein